jgi:hypothetical protein
VFRSASCFESAPPTVEWFKATLTLARKDSVLLRRRVLFWCEWREEEKRSTSTRLGRKRRRCQPGRAARHARDADANKRGGRRVEAPFRRRRLRETELVIEKSGQDRRYEIVLRDDVHADSRIAEVALASPHLSIFQHEVELKDAWCFESRHTMQIIDTGAQSLRRDDPRLPQILAEKFQPDVVANAMRVLGTAPPLDPTKLSTVFVDRENRFALEIDHPSGRSFVSFRVHNRSTTSSEYYEIDRETFASYRSDPRRATASSRKRRHVSSITSCS